MLDAEGLAANVADYPSLCDASILYAFSACVPVISLVVGTSSMLSDCPSAASYWHSRLLFQVFQAIHNRCF